MAFGKKQSKDAAELPPVEDAPAPPQADDLAASFAPPADAAPADGSLAALAAPEADPLPDGAAPPAEAADPLAGDLLNMFQETQIESEDKAVLVELSGEVEIGDLLDDLHTLASALGIVLESDDMAA